MSIANDLNDAMAASGDTFARMKVSSQARKKNPTLQAQWQVHVVTYEVGGKQETVLASLPVDRFSAAQVATLYHERWEIEGYQKLNAAQRHHAEKQDSGVGVSGAVGLLLGYNLSRREASQAPSRISG